VQDPRFTRRGNTPKAGVHVLARYLCNYFRRKEEEKCSRDVVQYDEEKGFVSLGLGGDEREHCYETKGCRGQEYGLNRRMSVVWHTKVFFFAEMKNVP
jgi:hypothetical protein